MTEIINTANVVTEKINENKKIPQFFQMKLDYIQEKAGELVSALATETSRVTELELAVMEAREQDYREKIAREEVFAELENMQREEDELREQVEKMDREMEAKEKLKEELLKRIALIEKDLDEEKMEEYQRHETLRKVYLEQRNCYNELQNIKGTVRVCVRIKPEIAPSVLPGRTVHHNRPHTQPVPFKEPFHMISFDDPTNELKLKMPPSVS